MDVCNAAANTRIADAQVEDFGNRANLLGLTENFRNSIQIGSASAAIGARGKSPEENIRRVSDFLCE